jgi:iron complex transport system permease protein
MKNVLKNVSIDVALCLLLFVIFIISLFKGRYDIDPVTVIKILLSPVIPIEHTWPAAMDTVVWNIRLPRTIAVILVGAGLSLSGVAFQGTFRNPLVSEHILGVSTGAGFGASLAILLFPAVVMIQIFAFVFGIVAVGFTFLISRVYKRDITLVLVLGGIIVGALFSAFTSLIKYLADPYDRLPTIVFWLMGSFAKITMNEVYYVAPVILVCTAVILLVRWKLNVLSLGEDEAKSLGLNTRIYVSIIVLCATLITAASVCISGIIGWVGLVIPHIGRMIVGPDHARLLPVTILIGASYLLAVDIIARNLTMYEIPIGIITSIVGAPFFIYLLGRNRAGWS